VVEVAGVATEAAAEAEGKVVVSASTTMHRTRKLRQARLVMAVIRNPSGGGAKGRVALVAPLRPKVLSNRRLVQPSLCGKGLFRGGRACVLCLSLHEEVGAFFIFPFFLENCFVDLSSQD
jgi:hypothetical protein